jgi:hypothetical protein
MQHNPQQTAFDFAPTPAVDDICARKHKGNPQSVEANKQAGSNKARDRQRVVEFIKSRGEYGATTEEASEALELRYTTASARFSDLKRDGLIVESGRTRKTRSGCAAAVCVVSRV